MKLPILPELPDHPLVNQAIEFSTYEHRNQTREEVNDAGVRIFVPYINHPIEVARLMLDYGFRNPIYLATAILHDTREDCGTSREAIIERFGHVVCLGVDWLSDFEKGNRATRKQLAGERLGYAPSWIQNIKGCDCVSNAVSIVRVKPDFWPVYRREIKHLMDVLDEMDNNLYGYLKITLDKCQEYWEANHGN